MKGKGQDCWLPEFKGARGWPSAQGYIFHCALRNKWAFQTSWEQMLVWVMPSFAQGQHKHVLMPSQWAHNYEPGQQAPLSLRGNCHPSASTARMPEEEVLGRMPRRGQRRQCSRLPFWVWVTGSQMGWCWHFPWQVGCSGKDNDLKVGRSEVIMPAGAKSILSFPVYKLGISRRHTLGFVCGCVLSKF